jgi:hypothetical protein
MALPPGYWGTPPRGGFVTSINWSAELKKIERQFDGLPPETPKAPAASQPATRPLLRRSQQLRQERDAVFGAVSRVVLVLSLSLAINAWPYDRACGAGLFAYLAAAGAIVAAAIWAAVGTWGGRAPRLHTVAMIAALWGLVLIAAQVLPRVDYARVDPKHRPTWRCWGPNATSVGVPTVNGLFRRR